MRPKKKGPRDHRGRGSSRLLGKGLRCAEYHGAAACLRLRRRRTPTPLPTQAARVLGISDRRVSQMLEAGELEGERDASGKWWIPQRVVHGALEDRGSPRGAWRRSSPTQAVPPGEHAGGSPASPERAPDDRESVRERGEDRGPLLSPRTHGGPCGAHREGREHPAGRLEIGLPGQRFRPLFRLKMAASASRG